MLIGEAKRLFEVWRLEGLPYEKILGKLKEYARGRRLDGDANQGKQAVDMNPASKEENRTTGEEEEGEEEQIEEEASLLASATQAPDASQAQPSEVSAPSTQTAPAVTSQTSKVRKPKKKLLILSWFEWLRK